ncbi:hypothetical protein PhCBS80983_g05561 [Powellomyces hirtus]|uniref:WDR59/RTC1-like RING zinc finger domain-containing protein n=1 Tax=Powellomyces hirtus TaxID=109895 RepID=A0A507DW94_9FUNG|nr:hypothetical protein PhCBS80983_g05561 [Powellomyces hirtus]
MKKAAVLTSVPAGSNGPTAGRDLPPSALLAQPVQHHVSPLRLRLTGQLTSVAASADMDWAVVAGREVLKIVAIYSDDVKEVLNLRAGAKMSTNFAIQDVKWGNSFAKSTVATAASNGAVVIWDLNRPNVHKLERILTEHTRAVNRISFHPTEPVLLLSASQDGSMRLWDLRAKSIARNAFEGRAESVRDVQFSPTNPYEFVAAFENGSIQKWDIRFPTQHERKWNAHNGLALTVDWHPDGRLAASGGRDRLIKVWDMKSESRLPLYTISTIAPVARVSWRPGSDTQLASCALATDYAIHLWDLARPYIANQSLEAHDGVTTGLLWRDPNIIWSCSKDRSFARHDIRAHAYRPLSCLNTSAAAWNVDGELTFAIDERPILSSAITATTSTSLPGATALANGPNTTGSDGVDTTTSSDESRLGLPPPIPATALTQGVAAAAVAAATSSYYPLRRALRKPPEKVVGDEKIAQYKPRQRTGIADTDTFDVHAFIAFATDLQLDHTDIWTSCDINAQLALDLGLLRTAQTWKIIQLLYGGRNPGAPEPSNLSALFRGAPDKHPNHHPSSSSLSSHQQSPGQVTPSAARALEALFAPLESTQSQAYDGNALDVPATGLSVRSDTIIGTNGFLEPQNRRLTVGSSHSDSALLKDIQESADPVLNKSDNWVDTYATVHRTDKFNSASQTPAHNGPFQVTDRPLDLDNNNDIEKTGPASARPLSGHHRQTQVQSQRPHHDHGQNSGRYSDEHEEDEEDGYSDTPDVSSSDSESSFTYGLKVGAGRRTLARFGIGTRPPVSDKGSHASKHTTNTIGRSFSRNRRRSQFSASALPSNNNSSDNINHASVPPRDVVLAPWNHEPVVRDTLSYYAEQGNVQMCVSIILVLGDLIRVDEKMEELWFWSYIDLLHRFKLWSPATAVIRAARIPSVRARNQESTTIHTICNHCSKPMLTSTPGAPNWACEHCGRLVNPCSLCHKTTKGLYVWCQGCTHGGHLACLTDWFSNDLECCTGCGHQCLSRQFSMAVDVGG